ncbi:MAG: (2Fe-2S)-binding protein [Chromatiaceae bacterium]|nr:(2Fe-2S)-binding protein [Chromatiaceae bacterium]MCP5313889.1 (2Fe-2S)-binding protein [Chromatiaceae bacterium]
MYVCICNGVTDHQIRAAVDRGVASMEQLGNELKVATCCGRCRDCANRILDEALAAQWAASDGLACACA